MRMERADRRLSQAAVARRIRAVREALNLTVAQMADRLNTSVTNIYRYESGDRNPNPEILRRIASLSDSEPADFYISGDQEVVEQLLSMLFAIVDLSMYGIKPGDALQQVSPSFPNTLKDLARLNQAGPMLREYLNGMAQLYYRRDWSELLRRERMTLLDPAHHASTRAKSLIPPSAIELPAQPGIYAIHHVASGSRYIGMAESIRSRCFVHCYHLHSGAHHCRLLQALWVRDSAEAFRFDVVEIVANRRERETREEYWIALYDQEKRCLNARTPGRWMAQPEINSRAAEGP